MNYEQVGVMTVAELAEAAGVGTTTVMRLVQTLDYPSIVGKLHDMGIKAIHCILKIECQRPAGAQSQRAYSPELAEAAGVGTTTVMRLVQTLDYPSFSAFKKDK